MASTLNPYVVHRVHTEGLFGMFKSKNAQPESKTSAPKAPARSMFNPFKKQNVSELFAKYAADTKKYSHNHLEAKKQVHGIFVCYYLVTPEKLLRCTTALAPGWGSSMEEMQSGTISCRSFDVVSNLMGDMIDVPYPNQNVLWMSTTPK